MSDTITVKRREATGSRASQRLRAEGHVPVVLYGHKEAVESLATPAKQIRKALEHKAKLLKLDGDVGGQAVIQDLQWDVFHRHLLHVDLLRVDAGERVQLSVPVELKGEAAGAKEGGVVSQILTTIDVEADPANLPETLILHVDEMKIGDSMHVSQVEGMPPKGKFITDPEAVVANCVPPAGEPALDDVAKTGEDPEVISKGGDAEEATEDSESKSEGD